MDASNIINQQLEAMELEELQNLMQTARQQGDPFSGITLESIVKGMLSGKPILDLNALTDGLYRMFFHQIFDTITFCVEILLICIFIGLLSSLSNSFGDHTVSRLAVIICNSSVIALSLHSFLFIYQLCLSTVELMAASMQALLPVLATLMISMGSFASGGTLHPMIMGAVTISVTVIQRYLLPAVFLSCVILLINSLTERSYMKKLGLFLRGFSIFAMGLLVTLFSGVTAIQGMISRSADGMLAKTARYSVDHFVPFIGGFAADSLDLILSCTLLIKNGIGIFGLILILTYLLTPLLKTISVALIYKVCALLIEPIGNQTISDSISEVGNTVVILAVILFLAALMFLIFLVVIISVGNGGILTR